MEIHGIYELPSRAFRLILYQRREFRGIKFQYENLIWRDMGMQCSAGISIFYYRTIHTCILHTYVYVRLCISYDFNT